MKVCFDISTLMTTSRFRGTGNYCLELARAFGRAGPLLDGLDLTLMLGPARSLPVVPLSRGLDSLDRAFPPGSRVLGDAEYLAAKHVVGRARLALARPDLYHSSEPTGTPRPPRRCKTLVTHHDVIPIIMQYPYKIPGLPWQARIPLERLRFKGVDHAIAISRCTRDDLVRHTPMTEQQTSVVYHGVDTGRFNTRRAGGEAARVRETCGTERPYFFYVGGFDARKQVPQMVQAFAERADEVEEALVICGKIWPEVAEQIQRLVAQYGVSGRVLTPGFVPDEMLPALYRNATAHVMLSLYEGFGMTITEAFACGCPVIAASASCVPEIAEDAALLVDPAAGVVHAAGEAMVMVATDQELRQTLRHRGLRRARFFTWDRCAEQTLEVYRKVLGFRTPTFSKVSRASPRPPSST